MQKEFIKNFYCYKKKDIENKKTYCSIYNIFHRETIADI